MGFPVSLMFPLYVSVCWYEASSLWSETRQYFIRTLMLCVLGSSTRQLNYPMGTMLQCFLILPEENPYDIAWIDNIKVKIHLQCQ